MKKVTTERRVNPVEHTDPEVLAFRAQFDERSPLDEIIRTVLSRCFRPRSKPK